MSLERAKIEAQARAYALKQARQAGITPPARPSSPPKIPLSAYVERVKRITLDVWQLDLCARLEKAFWLSRAQRFEFKEVNIGAGPAYMTTPSGFRIDSREFENKRAKGTRAAIHAPPQAGKSIIISQAYPAWILGYDPIHRFRLATYNISHSKAFSEVVLNILRSPEHAEAFPGEESRVSARVSTVKWFTNARRAVNDGQSSFTALGLQSGFVGNGADCFPANTLIETERGAIDIRLLYQLNCKPRVYAFDHKTGTVVLRRIEAVREIEADGLVEVITQTGKRFRCTPDHRAFVEGKGYTRAESLREGDRLIAAAHVPAMRPVQARGEQNLFRMLPRVAVNARGVGVLVVRARVPEACVRGAEESAERAQRFILLVCLLYSASRNQKLLTLQVVWQALFAKILVLLSRVQGRSATGEGAAAPPKDAALQILRDCVQGQVLARAILLNQLCGRGTFDQDEGCGKFSLQDGHELREVVCGDAPTDFAERGAQVRRLPETGSLPGIRQERPNGEAQQLAHTPHQRRCGRQYAREPDNSLLYLPCDSPQIKGDAVAVVRHLRPNPVKVYDLQVEGCRNFFAEGILVHNCLLMDDPYKSIEEALSEVIRDKTWRFYTDTAAPRLDENSNVFIMFHRYHQDDMGGRALATGDFELWRYEAQADGEYLDDESGRVFPPTLDRARGEYLSPRKPDSYYERQKKNVQVWNSQFQGRPTSEAGDFFDVKKLKTIPPRDVPAIMHEVRSWDNAATDGAGAYTAGLRMGMDADQNVYVFDVKRDQLGTADRQKLQTETAAGDGPLVHIKAPQDPGSAGKDVAFQFRQDLKEYQVTTEPVTGTKEARAYPWSLAVNQGKCYLVLNPDGSEPAWHKPLKSEMKNFPVGTYKDQIDAGGDGYSHLLKVFHRGLVVKGFSDANLVGWSRFRDRFGTKVPAAWDVAAAVRVESDASKPSGWAIVARAGEAAQLEEVVFIVSSARLFTADPGLVLAGLKADLVRTCEGSPSLVWLGKTSADVEGLALEKYGLHLTRFEDEAGAGIPETNWYFQKQRAKNPFSEKGEAARCYLLVDDGQVERPKDEKGQISIRQDLASWSFNEKGEPQPYGGVVLDCARMPLYNFYLIASPMTPRERRQSLLPEHLRDENLRKKIGTDGFVEDYWSARHAENRIRRQEEKEEREEAKKWADIVGRPTGHRRYRK